MINSKSSAYHCHQGTKLEEVEKKALNKDETNKDNTFKEQSPDEKEVSCEMYIIILFM